MRIFDNDPITGAAESPAAPFFRTGNAGCRCPEHQAPVSPPGGTATGLTDRIQAAPETASARPEGQRRGRLKLWEIPPRYRCPVIGTCLSVAELRRIGERHASKADGPASDYEIHVSFVAAADDRNSLSLATHKAMDRKFSGMLKRFERARDAEGLLVLWAECLTRGEVAAAFWAIMTHPRGDERVQRLAYEEVHMLSHQVGAAQRADLKRLAETEQALATLQRDFDALQRRTRAQLEAREASIRDLERELREREAELAVKRARLAGIEARLAEHESGQTAARVAELEARLRRSEESLREGNAALAQERRRGAEIALQMKSEAEARQAREAECEALERLLAGRLDAADADDAPTSRCDDCPNLECARRDLGGRLVLCVGGRRGQVQQFARLVEACNGRFDHHDGGLEERDQRLDALLAGADAVVCATDYVSHSAYYRTKRYCKRTAKPHVLLLRSGLGAFAQALERVSP